MNRGYLWAASAFAMWGLLPLYWQVIRHVPADQIVAHRILWSCVWLIPILYLSGQLKPLREAIRQPRTVLLLAVAAVLVCVNWLGFVWAVTHGRVIESSLGYFINPLMSVVIGVLILRERLRTLQQIAILIAGAGLICLTIQYGRLPWIAIVLAVSFCLYGLAKKTTKVHPVVSLTIETYVLLIPTLAYLSYQHLHGQGSFLNTSLITDTMLVGGGLATTIPLLCFAAGAQRIPLSAVGMLQYIGPTLQFLLGTYVNREPFDQWMLIGFACVWIACVFYAMDSWRAHRALKEGR